MNKFNQLRSHPCGHYTLDQRRNLVQNNVTTLFQLHFNVVPMSDARWDGPWSAHASYPYFGLL